MRTIWTGLLLALAGCVGAQKPMAVVPTPPMPPAPPAAIQKRAAPLVASVPARTYCLVWDCAPGSTCEVWQSKDLTNWFLNQIVQTNRCPIVTAFPQMFFRVRTVDPETGIASGWGTAGP